MKKNKNSNMIKYDEMNLKQVDILYFYYILFLNIFIN